MTVFWQLQATLSLLFVICKAAVIPSQTCPRLTRQESEAVWARYWAIEARLHWSFYLIPSIRSGSANTLPVIDAKYVNNSYKKIDGSKKCPRTGNYFLTLLPDCPVYYVIQYDQNRIPSEIVHARCSCSRCRHDNSDEKGCSIVYTYTKVLRRLDSCEFVPVLEAVPVACACTSMVKFVPAG